jgi:hypothetical protein
MGAGTNSRLLILTATDKVAVASMVADTVHVMRTDVTVVTEQTAGLVVPIFTDTWPGLLPKLVPVSRNVAKAMLLADPDVDCREAAVAQTEAPEVAQLVTGDTSVLVVEAKVTEVTPAVYVTPAAETTLLSLISTLTL